MQRASASYTFGRFHLDSAECRLTRDGQAIPLTPKAFDTLLALVQHAGHALTKDELMRAIWPDGFVEEVNLAYNISVLRKALADGQPGEKYIETVPKLGYRFVAPVNKSPSPLGGTSRWEEGRGGVRTNLPAQLTRFIGREKEIAQVKNLIGANRLVTLTGAGGVGKSRLALEVSSTLVGVIDSVAATPSFRDGSWWIELAPLADPTLVPQTVAAALGLIEGSGRPALDILADFLRNKRALLILDNCEHLVVACAWLADALLRNCSDLTILATSRELLGIAGEAVYRVPSLAFPDSGRLPPVEDWMTFDAMRLFVDRAAMTASGFEVTSHNATVVAEVCRRLDGIPLAIELAAARMNALSVEQIARRLDDRFGLLTAGSRTVLPRHQTLRAAMAWSFDLLTPAERDLLARLSVFAGGFTAEATQAVSDQPGALDLLAKLVDKSLVAADVRGEAARYRLLETVRQFAMEQLRQTGAEFVTRDRHLGYFLQLAERAEPELHRVDQIAWFNRLESELDNFRTALDWSLKHEQHTWAGLRMAAALLGFWHLRDHRREGRDWLDLALSSDLRAHGMNAVSQSHAQARAHTQNAIAFLAALDHDLVKLIGMAEQALVISRDLGEPGKRSAAFALLHLAVASLIQQQSNQTKSLAEQSLALFQEIGDKFGMSECCHVLGQAALTTGDFEQAKYLYEMDLALCRETGAKDGYGNALRYLGDVSFLKGDFDEAEAFYEKTFAIDNEIGTRVWTGVSFNKLVDVALVKGQFDQAVVYAKRSLALGEEIGDKGAIGHSYFHLAKIARARGEYEQSALHAELALCLFHEIGNTGATIEAIWLLGAAALAQGQHEQATQWFEDALTIGREMGGKFSIALALFGLGQVAQARHDFDQARSLHKEALALWRGSHLRKAVAYSLDALACVATAQGQAQRAARLFGAGEALYQLIRFEQSPFERDLHERGVAAVRAELSEVALSEAWAEGDAMTVEQAVAFALSEAH